MAKENEITKGVYEARWVYPSIGHYMTLVSAKSARLELTHDCEAP